MAVTIQLRGDTAANWAAANPVLSERELVVVTDTYNYKIGDGVTAFNSLPYYQLSPTVAALTMGAIADPSPPADGQMNFYAKKVSGRSMPKWRGPSGLHTPAQPALFQNSILLYSPNTTTTLSMIGGIATNSGTLSHPTPTVASFGMCTNFASAATANAAAGTGSTLNFVNVVTGFFMVARLWWPDVDYGSGATGSRFFVGANDQAVAAIVAIDNPGGNRAGFAMSTNLAETNWQFSTKNGTNEARVDTGMPFANNKLFDFFVFCPPGGAEVFWRIDNITDGTSAEGSATDYLPLTTAMIRPTAFMATLTTVARNMRFKKLYCETDD